ncbi:hypothetical protein IUY40_02800 [Flavobacterium sp. ALJ2]|uniref:hypothetical protein n=1 Tax=Flavobacterium sp. ALJ2 TaxID=2786960 RepID=UPI0018A092CB|nr:hypothetical protein [Flavobacterium sp. ALJ2]MBF7090474.1 hypothetical protein [Flavobacterium sp. ALJ2]
MKQIICPNCQEEYDINENESYFLYSTDDIEELECGCCEKLFFVQVRTSYSFETQKDVDSFY